MEVVRTGVVEEGHKSPCLLLFPFAFAFPFLLPHSLLSYNFLLPFLSFYTFVLPLWPLKITISGYSSLLPHG